MALESLCLLAIACSIGSLLCSVVTCIRSVPARVRKQASEALQISEQTQAGFVAAAHRMISFEQEITREREASRADLDEAERKRRQAAAKLSAMTKNGTVGEESKPTTFHEALEQFPPGDPRRLKLLRGLKSQMDGAA